MNYIFLAYDAAAILMVCVCMYIGKKNGFAKTFVQMFGSAAAVVAALASGKIVSSLLYTTFLQPAIIKKLESSIENAVDTESVIDGLEKAVSEMPAASKILFDFSSVQSELADAADLETGIIAEKVESSVIEPMLLPLLETILFILSLVILLIIVGLLAKSTRGVNDVPVVGGINGFFGAVSGFIGGVAAVCISASVISLVLKVKGPSDWMSEEIIERTFVFKYFYAFINGEILPF